MKTVKKSDFAGLVKYITDEQNKRERILFQSVTNCHSDDPRVAALEVANTQAQNKRATSDKTYHLIISFPAGDSFRRSVEGGRGANLRRLGVWRASARQRGPSRHR
ncbi:relaxase/mobilization nuclease domain-containing protein [Roseateles sp. GG27B]